MKTKNATRYILFTLTLSAMLLSACSGVPATGDNSNVNGSPSTTVIVDNGNSSNSNDANSNDANSNDNTNTGSNGNSNANDSGVEIVGIVEVITEDTITINGVTYPLPADFTQLTDLVSVGDQVIVRVIINADGTFTILQLEILTGDDNGNNANSNDANSNDANSNDDNGNNANSNDANSNDDNGNDDNSNDDNGGNGNDNNDSGGNDNG